MNPDCGSRPPVLLFAGGRPMDAINAVSVISKAISGLGLAYVRAAYVGAANGDNQPFYLAIKPILLKAGANKVVFARLAKNDADVQNARALINDADVVFISGGEVEDGINWIRKHGLFDFFKGLYPAGKLLIGISAGTIMLGSHWVRWDDPKDDSTAGLFECLGVVPAIFDTHAEDEDWIELKTALRLMGEGSRGFGVKKGGILESDGAGNLVNIKETYLTFTYRNGGYEIL